MVRSRRMRMAALAVGLLFLLSLALSVALIAAKSGHECVGEGCSTCDEIAHALFGSGAIAVAGVGRLWALCLALAAVFCVRRAARARSTLVSLKVLLLN